MYMKLLFLNLSLYVLFSILRRNLNFEAFTLVVLLFLNKIFVSLVYLIVALTTFFPFLFLFPSALFSFKRRLLLTYCIYLSVFPFSHLFFYPFSHFSCRVILYAFFLSGSITVFVFLI